MLTTVAFDKELISWPAKVGPWAWLPDTDFGCENDSSIASFELNDQVDNAREEAFVPNFRQCVSWRWHDDGKWQLTWMCHEHNFCLKTGRKQYIVLHLLSSPFQSCHLLHRGKACNAQDLIHHTAHVPEKWLTVNPRAVARRRVTRVIRYCNLDYVHLSIH